jgi:ribonuclease HII
MKLADRINIDLNILKEKEGYSHYDWIIGLDEVGWGCIAGDLIIGAVAVHKDLLANFPEDAILLKIRDSKKLSAETRFKINKDVLSRDWGDKLKFFVGRASVEHINKFGLSSAYDECLRQIIDQIPVWIKNYLFFLDGKRRPKILLAYPTSLMIKGDDNSLVIGLASIIAKEFRDNLMEELNQKYPQYDFSNNKGYGTEKHVKALKEFGISPVHRIKGTETILRED